MSERVHKTETIKKAVDTLAAINAFYNDNGWWPSRRELVVLSAMSSTSSLNYQLELLCKLGYLEIEPEVARAMRITNAGYQVLRNRSVENDDDND
jgi:hypothetical protein